MTVVEFSAGGTGAAPPITASWSPAAGPVPTLTPPVATYEVRLTKPLLGGANEYRWVTAGWPYAQLFLQPSNGDSALLQWAVNTPGQLKVEVDRWRFREVWDEADFNPGGAPIRNIVPESTTMWVYRDGAPIWGGFLRDIDADPTGSPNITLTGEEFTGIFPDVTLTDNWRIESQPFATVLEAVLARELRAPWMHVHYHGGGIDPAWLFTAEYTQLETRALSEIIEQLAIGAKFEWQQWISGGEAYFGVHPVKAGFDYQTLGAANIEWGEGTANTVDQIRYTYSTRATRTRATVVGFEDVIKIRDYNHPLGVPRRDQVYRDQTLNARGTALAAEELVRRTGLPMLTARTALRVGEFDGGWPWLWLDDGAGSGCSPVGSRFHTRIVDAGMVYEAILRATTWGVSVGPAGEFMVLDLVQDEAIAAGLALEIQVIPTPSIVDVVGPPTSGVYVEPAITVDPGPEPLPEPPAV